MHVTLSGRISLTSELAVSGPGFLILVCQFGRLPTTTLRISVSVVGLTLNTDNLSHSQSDRNTFSGSLDSPDLEKIFREQFQVPIHDSKTAVDIRLVI